MISKKMIFNARRFITHTLCPFIGAGIFLVVFNAAEAHAAIFI